jgi:hypothetical protein
MTKLLLLTTMMFPLQSQCTDVDCMAKILFSESRGESLECIIAIGEASKSRAKRTNKSICHISGVTRKNPPERLKSYWYGMAKLILNDKRTSTINDADSWVKGKKPSINHKDTKIRKVIGLHTFYVAGGKLI